MSFSNTYHSKIIAFTGPRHSGKGTAAKYLTDNYNFKEINFADPFKIGIAAMFGWTVESMYNPALKELVDPRLGFSRRRAMQVIPTEGVRNHLNPEAWNILAAEKIDSIVSCNYPRNRVVIGDLRFANEVRLLKKYGDKVKIIYCCRPIRSTISYDETVDSHESEGGINQSDCDIIIKNDTNLHDYAMRLSELTSRLKL